MQSIIIEATGDTFTVKDKRQIQKLQNTRIGQFADEKEEYVLEPYEIIYLCYTNQAQVVLDNKTLSLDDVISLCTKLDPESWVKFTVFYDLRKRGFTVRPLKTVHPAFLVYKKKSDPLASYIFFILEEGKKISLNDLKQMVEETRRLRKEAVLAIVGKEGNITYYSLSLLF